MSQTDTCRLQVRGITYMQDYLNMESLIKAYHQNYSLALRLGVYVRLNSLPSVL